MRWSSRTIRRAHHATRSVANRAAQHRSRYGQDVGPDNVIMLSGAQNALFVCAQCVGGPGDEIVVLDPMYATYPATVESGGATLVRAGSPPPPLPCVPC